jgi:hypothetical protein
VTALEGAAAGTSANKSAVRDFAMRPFMDH